MAMAREKEQADKSNSSSGIHTTSHLRNTEHHRPLKAEANPTLGSNAGEGEICTPRSAVGSAAGGNWGQWTNGDSLLVRECALGQICMRRSIFA